MSIQRYQRLLVTVAIAVAMLPQCALARLNATLGRAQEAIAISEVASAVPSASVLRMLALGHNEAMADLVWLNALSFFGQHTGLRKDPGWLNPHLDAMSGLDPRFVLAYSWAGTAIMYGGAINNESVSASSAILERGVQRFPYAWDLAFMLGVNYYFEMRPSNEEERIAWRTYGAEMIGRAASLPNAPSFLAPAATSLLTAQGGGRSAYEIALREIAWAESAAQTDALRATIAQSGSGDSLVVTDARRQLIEALLKKPSLPAVPAALVVLLHPDPVLATIPDGAAESLFTNSDAQP